MNENIGELHKENSEAKADQSADTFESAEDSAAKTAEATSSEEASPKQAPQSLEEKCAELEDKYKRLWADQQNMTNRFQREREDIHKYAAANTIECILPAIDNFDFAKKSINENTNFEEVVKSIDMLQEQLLLSLKSIGLEEVATDILYNPEFHEAVSNIKDAEKEEGTIIEVIKKGYKLKERVLRAATVIVTTQE